MLALMRGQGQGPLPARQFPRRLSHRKDVERDQNPAARIRGQKPNHPDRSHRFRISHPRAWHKLIRLLWLQLNLKYSTAQNYNKFLIISILYNIATSTPQLPVFHPVMGVNEAVICLGAKGGFLMSHFRTNMSHNGIDRKRGG